MPRLVIKKGEGVGRDKVLSGGECVIGRGPDADFTIEDNLASRRHFRVMQEEGVYWVEDLGSTNGTLVNGRRTQRVQLMDGDQIQAGSTEVSFVQKDLLGMAGTKAKQPPVIKKGQVPPKATPPKEAPPKAAPTPARRKGAAPAPDSPGGQRPLRSNRRLIFVIFAALFVVYFIVRRKMKGG